MMGMMGRNYMYVDILSEHLLWKMNKIIATNCFSLFCEKLFLGERSLVTWIWEFKIFLFNKSNMWASDISYRWRFDITPSNIIVHHFQTSNDLSILCKLWLPFPGTVQLLKGLAHFSKTVWDMRIEEQKQSASSIPYQECILLIVCVSLPGYAYHCAQVITGWQTLSHYPQTITYFNTSNIFANSLKFMVTDPKCWK